MVVPARLGITVNLKPMDPTVISNMHQTGTYHFREDWNTSDIPDPDDLTAYSVDDALSSHDYATFYKNAQLTALTRQAEETTTAAARQSLYDQIQELWARDTPFFALFEEPFVNVVGSHVQGLHQSSLGFFVLQGVHKA